MSTSFSSAIFFLFQG